MTNAGVNGKATGKADAYTTDEMTTVAASRDSRDDLGYSSAGPTMVVTDPGILRPDPKTKELTLTGLHPGATAEQAREATGWDLKVAEDPQTTEPPTDKELEVLRDLRARTEASRRKT